MELPVSQSTFPKAAALKVASASLLLMASLLSVGAPVALAGTPNMVTATLANVTKVAGGANYTCALKTDQTVWCWGIDADGELGDGTRGDSKHNRLKPVQVVQGTGKLTPVKDIATGGVQSCAVKTDNTVWCWGFAADGEVGDGTTGDSNGLRLKPVQVVQGTGHLTDVAAVTAGNQFTCALKTDGTVWCWGSNSFGQLGDGSEFDSLVPVEIVLGAGYLTNVKAIAAGGVHVCALKTDNTVWCWGDAEDGETGDGTTGDENGQRRQPVQVLQGSGNLTSVAAISANSGGSSCAVKTDGTAWCWGYNEFGQLGDGTRTTRLKATQVVKGTGKLTGVAGIDTDGLHTCAIKSDGTAWCWGSNASGELGDGTRGDANHRRLKPVQVVQGSGTFTNASSIAAGGLHSCATKSDGSVWCWGSDFYGQLGDGTRGGTTHRRLKPVQTIFA